MAGVEAPEIPRKPRKRGFPGPKIPAPPIRGEDSGGDFRGLDGRQQSQTAAEVEHSDPCDDWPTVQSIIPAAGAAPVNCSAPCWVFDMHRQPVNWQKFQTGEAPAYGRAIEQAGPVTRHKRIHYTETAEWSAREAARRARQKPPRPSRAAKTMSRQLAEMLGLVAPYRDAAKD